MKKMKKPAHGDGGLLTLGELVTLAYDITPNRASAVKLLEVLLGGHPIRVRMNSGG